MELFSNIQNSNVKRFILDEFIANFIVELENEILPKVVRQIELPKTSSIFKIKVHELRSHRYPKMAKDIFNKKDPYKKNAIIQKFAMLKEAFNGHEVNEASSSLYEPSVNYNTVLLEKLKPEFETPNSLIESIAQKIDISDLFEIAPIDKNLISSNEIKLEEVVERKDFLQFDDDIKKKILNNSVFMKFINQIEISLIRFMEKNSYNFNCKLFYEVDFEIPDLKKIILLININNMNIEEKLDFWDQIDDFLRYRIEEFANFLLNEQKKKFLDYNKRFFTNVQLN